MKGAIYSMFTEAEFQQGLIQEEVKELRASIKEINATNIDDFNAEIERVYTIVKTYSDAPRFNITRTLYPVGDTEQLDKATITVRPSLAHALTISDMKHTFTVVGDKNFSINIANHFFSWFIRYNEHKKLQANLDAFNEEVAQIVEEAEVPYTLVFGLGEGILDATEDYAVIGLSVETIKGLGRLPLFNKNYRQLRDNYADLFKDLLKECPRPYDIIRANSTVTKDLDLPKRRRLVGLFRETVIRKYHTSRKGFSYIDKDGVFAIVDKQPISEDELKEVELDENTLVLDNEKPTKEEQREGKSKILVTLRVRPFNKTDETPVDKSLQDLVS